MMKSIVATIARRELNSFFDSLTAYILLIAFLGFSGFFTWIYGSDVFMRKEADLDVFFGIAKWTLFFFIPAVTMKMLAEEKDRNTRNPAYQGRQSQTAYPRQISRLPNAHHDRAGLYIALLHLCGTHWRY